MWTGFPRQEQPGTSAILAEQTVERQKHDTWGQTARGYEVQDTVPV